MPTGPFPSRCKPVSRPRCYLVVVLSVLFAFPAQAEEATIAVAANFLTTARALEAAYEAESGHQLNLAHGSTGRLFAQILSGAPFDVFLAADQARPEELEERGLTSGRRTYSIGEVVAVSRRPFGTNLAETTSGVRVALANPDVAPYGAAACAALAALGGDCGALEARLGDSVGQAASLFVTGNADIAFLARSQVAALDVEVEIMSLDVPEAKIPQDAVLLARGAANPAARGFFDFLGSPVAKSLILEAGYEVVE